MQKMRLEALNDVNKTLPLIRPYGHLLPKKGEGKIVSSAYEQLLSKKRAGKIGSSALRATSFQKGRRENRLICPASNFSPKREEGK
jgi:hypothetical protein